MKRILIAIITLFVCFCAEAQNNHIFFTEYQPDTCFTFHNDSDSLVFDLDQDGLGDIVITSHYQSGVGSIAVINTPLPDWQWSWVYQSQFTPLTDSTLINGDLRWENDGGVPGMYPEFTHYAFRHLTDNGYRYGWAYIYASNVSRVCIARVGYCDIADYPLVWGQTELYDNVSENGTPDFATVLPNPNNGVFTVVGENLRQIEVLDVLGQRIATLQAAGDRTDIDLSSQPAGVYLINVTDHNGRQCVKKVVKN